MGSIMIFGLLTIDIILGEKKYMLTDSFLFHSTSTEGTYHRRRF